MQIWTPDQEARLRELWAAGHSASVIASQLDMIITRSAVLGKVRRLNLPYRLDEQQRGRLDRKIRPVPRPKSSTIPPKSAKRSVDPREVPEEQRKQLMELENNHCRWPFGHPGAPNFFFCGHPSADISNHRPYCEAHAAIAEGDRHATNKAQVRSRFYRNIVPATIVISR